MNGTNEGLPPGCRRRTEADDQQDKRDERLTKLAVAKLLEDICKIERMEMRATMLCVAISDIAEFGHIAMGMSKFEMGIDEAVQFDCDDTGEILRITLERLNKRGAP